MKLIKSLCQGMLCLGGLLSFALVNAPSAQAAQFNYQSVIKDPDWVIHVDADALRATAVGRALLEQLDKPELQAKFDIFQGIFSFDPRKSLHGLTLYGASTEAADGVALIYADVDAARLSALADMAGEHHTLTNKGLTIHTWVDAKDREKNPDAERTYATVFESRIVVFARKESRLMEAIDVLNHTKPGLKEGGLFPKPESSSTLTVIQGAARKLNVSEAGPQAAMLKNAKTASFQMGEAGSNLVATLSVTAETEDAATQMSVIAQGLLALASLQADKGDAAKIAKAIAITREGETVSVRLKLPDGDAVNMIKSIDKAEKEAKTEESAKPEKSEKPEKAKKADNLEEDEKD